MKHTHPAVDVMVCFKLPFYLTIGRSARPDVLPSELSKDDPDNNPMPESSISKTSSKVIYESNQNHPNCQESFQNVLPKRPTIPSSRLPAPDAATEAVPSLQYSFHQFSSNLSDEPTEPRKSRKRSTFNNTSACPNQHMWSQILIRSKTPH